MQCPVVFQTKQVGQGILCEVPSEIGCSSCSSPNPSLPPALTPADLVPREVGETWLKYFREELPTVAFKCNTQQQADRLGRKRMPKRSMLDSGAGSLQVRKGGQRRKEGEAGRGGRGGGGYSGVGWDVRGACWTAVQGACRGGQGGGGEGRGGGGCSGMGWKSGGGCWTGRRGQEVGRTGTSQTTPLSCRASIT